MFNITSGNIQSDRLYLVYGSQNVTYNDITYSSGQQFRGVADLTTYSFSGSGTQLVYEVLEEQGVAIVYEENLLDNPIFPDTTLLIGFAIEFQQNANDIGFNDVTLLNSFAIELIDFPFYSFAVTEIRL
jgi:hypothetical protein